MTDSLHKKRTNETSTQGRESLDTFLGVSSVKGEHDIAVIEHLNVPAGSYQGDGVDQIVLVHPISGRGNTRLNFDGSIIEAYSNVDYPRFAVVPKGLKSAHENDFHYSSVAIGVPDPIMEYTKDALGIQPTTDLEALHLNLHYNDHIRRLCLRIHESTKSEAPIAGLVVDHAAYSIASTLLTLSNQLTRPPAKSYPLTDEQLAIITDQMVSQLGERLKLTDLAKTFDWDVFRFSRSFKAKTGVSPHQYLLQLRIDHACQQLAVTQNAIAEIAYTCGFSNQAHMTTVFVNRVGATPAAFRQAFQG
ncbi:MAG: AraC family transcriptional regulator [Pseudomonadota bacterium]